MSLLNTTNLKFFPRSFIILLFSIQSYGCAVHDSYISGFKPIEPNSKTVLLVVPHFVGAIRHHIDTDVESFQPTFKWGTVPGIHEWLGNDVPFIQTNYGEVGKVSFELRIWEGENYWWSTPVYARRGITEPQHTLEIALKPSTTYLWTVRAWFKLNGQVRVSEWSMAQEPHRSAPTRKIVRERGKIPLRFLYHFETPSI